MITHQDRIKNAIDETEQALRLTLGGEVATALRDAIAALRRARNFNRTVNIGTSVTIMLQSGQAQKSEIEAICDAGPPFAMTFFRVKGISAWFRVQEEGRTWFWND